MYQYIFVRKIINLEFPNKIFYNPVINIPICWASEKKTKHRQQAAAEKQTADNTLTFILAAEIRNVYLRLKLSHSVTVFIVVCIMVPPS